MAGRPTSNKADIEALKKLNYQDNLVDLRPLAAFVMRHCGCSYREIGEVFGVTRQMAETLVEKKERQL